MRVSKCVFVPPSSSRPRSILSFDRPSDTCCWEWALECEPRKSGLTPLVHSTSGTVPFRIDGSEIKIKILVLRFYLIAVYLRNWENYYLL